MVPLLASRGPRGGEAGAALANEANKLRSRKIGLATSALTFVIAAWKVMPFSSGLARCSGSACARGIDWAVEQASQPS